MKLSNKVCIFFYCCLLPASSLHADNPIIADIGMSDPHVRIFNNKVYLFCGHDAHPDDRTWVMRDWRIFSTTDLIDWKHEGVISPKDNYMVDNSTDCWAGDAATRNGRYFFYFSDRKRGVGVMTSNKPEGPYKDALGKALVAPMHDPTILIDDDADATPYLVYGDKAGGSFHIAALNDDMISLKEDPRPILIQGEEWEKAPEWMDKNYIFKHKDHYYLSWGQDYAISSDIYGPYECVGSVGEGHHLSEFAHGSFFWWKGQFYHIWCYYLRQGFKYRESIITYCHLDDNGHIVTDTDFLDKHFETGVGQYNTCWEKIEAEWYTEISPGIKKQGSLADGFILTNIKDQSWIRFANVSFSKTSGYIKANATSNSGKGSIEVRAGSPEGRLLGTLPLTEKAGQSITCSLDSISGKNDIVLVCKGENDVEITLDWIRFENTDSDE